MSNVVSVRALKLLVGALALLGAVSAAAERVPPGTEQEIRDRLTPIGTLCRAGEDCGGGGAVADSAAAMSGEQVYNQFCGTCHVAGIAGAPTLDDAEAWEPRLAQGMDTLWDHTLNGLNAMPPKGTCMNCSDEELRAAVDYMVEAVQ